MQMALAAAKTIITTSDNSSSSSTVITRNRAPCIAAITMITALPLMSKLHNHFQYSVNPLFQSKLPATANITTTLFSCAAMANSSTSTVSDAPQLRQNINPTTTSSWSEFASNVSGEWDGFGAEFTTEGKPIELPESVVPEAYREWEVKVFDWQTQCPTLAQPQDFVMTYKTIRLLPTVGCEADAATRYSIDEKIVGEEEANVSAFAYQSDGSYVAVWPIEDDGNYKQLELEYCLINPRDKESRVRIIQVVHVDNVRMALRNIRVFCEQWYGPFRNGEQLGGCAISDSPFASTAGLKASEVVGAWQSPSAVATFDASQTNLLQEVSGDILRKSVRDECDLILLPKQLWCSLKGSNDGETCCEVGWLFDHGSAITASCIFSSDKKLKEISIARETAILEEVQPDGDLTIQRDRPNPRH